MKIYSFYCKAELRLKRVCFVKHQPQEQSHKKSHEPDILQHLQIDQLIFASYRDASHELFCVFRDFYASGTQVTKSLELATNDKKRGKILTKKLPNFKTRISEIQTRDICPNPPTPPAHPTLRGPQEKMV